MSCTFSNRLRRSVVAVCSLVLLVSCTTVPNVFCDHTTIISKFGEETSLKGELLTDSALLFNRVFVRDSMVIAFQSKNADRIFRVMNLQGQTLGQFGLIGRANNEFVNTFFFEQYYHNNQGELVLWIGDLSKNKLAALNIPQSLARQQVVIERVIETPTAASFASFVLNDSLVCMLDFVKDNFNMILREVPSNFVRSEVAVFSKAVPEDYSHVYISSQWCMTPDQQNVINVVRAVNQINKFSFADQRKKAVAVYKAPEITFENIVDQNEGLPLMAYYKRPTCDSKYIYALYAGVEYMKEDQEENVSEVHVFDHDLNPVRLIRLDKNICHITIDPSNKMLYGLGYGNMLWKFPLPAGL